MYTSLGRLCVRGGPRRWAQVLASVRHQLRAHRGRRLSIHAPRRRRQPVAWGMRSLFTATERMPPIVLHVEGMKCGGCVSGVQRRLEGLPGVVSANVTLVTKRAYVEVDGSVEQSAVVGSMCAALEDGGFKGCDRDATSVPPLVVLHVEGMKCGGCVSHVQRRLEEVPGVARARVTLMTKQAYVEVDGSVDAGSSGFKDAVLAALRDGGFGGWLVGGDTPSAPLHVSLRTPHSAEEIRGALDGTPLRDAVRDVQWDAEAGTATLTVWPAREWVDTSGGAGIVEELCSTLGERGVLCEPARQQDAAASVPDGHPTVRFVPPILRDRTLAWSWGLLGASVAGHAAHMVLCDAASSGAMMMASHIVQMGVAVAALALPARELLTTGLSLLRRGEPNMDSMVSVGVLAAFGQSTMALLLPGTGWGTPAFHEPVMLLAFVLLGRALENRARVKAASTLQELASLQPQRARLVPYGVDPTLDEQYAQKAYDGPVDAIVPGSFVLVSAGERIPCDGDVVRGMSSVDESVLTGESVPVNKCGTEHEVGAGDGSTSRRVLSGTLCVEGSMVVRATEAARNGAARRILDLVETAQANKAPVERLADRIAGVFTWGVLGAATATAVGWGLFGASVYAPLAAAAGAGGTPLAAWGLGLQLGTSVAVVSCPCALGLATPTAVVVGTTAALQEGLLVRGGDVLERLASVDAVVLDKTGTLTTGVPTVADVNVNNDTPGGSPLQLNTPQRVLQVAAAVEAGVRHPLAAAIVQHASSLKPSTEVPLVSNHSVTPGRGASATVTLPASWSGAEAVEPRTAQVFVGSLAYLHHHAVPITSSDTADTPLTTVFVGTRAGVHGTIAIGQQLRPGAAATVRDLHAAGVEVFMVTGDAAGPARTLASQVGIPATHVVSGCSPKDKVTAVEAIKSTGTLDERGGAPPSTRRVVAFLGDGVNDAPAIATADVGMAMGCGTDTASTAADIVLTRDAITSVVAGIQLSQATMRTVRQNLGWALGYNVVAIPLAAGILLPTAGVLLSPAVAGGMMAASSVLVVSNARLLKARLRNAAS